MINIVYNVFFISIFQKVLLKVHPYIHRILYYHILSDAEEECSYYYNPNIINFNVLVKQVRWLRNNGFIAVSVQECLADPQRYKNKRTFSISTDDGYSQNYSLFAPYFEKEKIPCILFLCNNAINNQQFLAKDRLVYIERNLYQEDIMKVAGLLTEKYNLVPFSKNSNLTKWSNMWPVEKIDEISKSLWQLLLLPDESELVSNIKPYLSEEQVRDLIKRGFTIGSHTNAHLDLSKLSSSLVEHEIVGSITNLRQRFNVPVEFFSYPYGKRVNPALEEEMIKKSGCSLFFSTRNDLNYGAIKTCWGRDRMEHSFHKSLFWFLAVPLIRRAINKWKS